MLKHHALVSTGLAALLVAPALTQTDELQILERALADTARALDVLTGLQQRWDQDPDGFTEILGLATEPPMLDDRSRGDRLAELRSEVSILQMELDALETEPPPRAPGRIDLPLRSAEPLAAQPAEDSPTMRLLEEMGHIPVGLDRRARRILQRMGKEEGLPPEPETRTPAASHVPSSPPPVVTADDAEVTPESSADPLGEGKACYFAGRYQRGLKLLESMPEDINALYWKARCLEKLDLDGQAIETLENVVAMTNPDSYEGRRARTDLEFLQWRRSFLEGLPSGVEVQRSQR